MGQLKMVANMSKISVLFAYMTTVILGLPNYGREAPSVPGISYEPPAKNPTIHEQTSAHGTPYNFQWAVRDAEAKLDYGQKEESDGSLVTGEYRVLLPDG